MSKILEVKNCWECSKRGYNPILGIGCKITKEIFKHPYSDTVSPNCPLPDYKDNIVRLQELEALSKVVMRGELVENPLPDADWWKKELLNFITLISTTEYRNGNKREYLDTEALKQKIMEM